MNKKRLGAVIAMLIVLTFQVFSHDKARNKDNEMLCKTCVKNPYALTNIEIKERYDKRYTFYYSLTLLTGAVIYFSSGKRNQIKKP